MITNKGDIPLAMAVWIVNDDYDYIDEPNYISATRLMKPLRHIILPPRIPEKNRVSDLEDRIGIAMGNAFHDSVEKAWVQNYRTNLKRLGYPEGVIERVLINPTKEELASKEDPIPIYLEQRDTKKITVNGIEYNVGGKFDILAEGMLQDVKSTTSFTWIYGGKDDDYILQGSLYRWIHQDKVKEDFIRINFIFTDWRKTDAKQNPNYPQSRIQYKDYPLMSIKETEQWVRNKIALVQKYRDSPEKEIPECTDEELWRSAPKFKYFSNPDKTDGRSTKNFSDLVEARKHLAEKNKGVIITEPGEVKRCMYCDAFPLCTQRKKYFHD